MWQAAGYGWQYGMAGSKVWVWNAAGMGMGMGMAGMGMGMAARYGYGMQRVWVWVWQVWVWNGYGYGRYGYGMQRVMVGDMVWQAARRGSADRTVFASADHHCLGEEVRALNDIDAKQLDEKQMGSVIYLRRY